MSLDQQLASLGILSDGFSDVVSSGDATREYLRKFAAQGAGWKLGPERDNVIYEGIEIDLSGTPETAAFISCTGPFDDENDTLDQYQHAFTLAAQRKIVMICANPDIVVERGDRLIYCAGAIAELYRELGGEVIFYGKPHRPIYQRAMELAHGQRDGAAVQLKRVLAIGDSVRTDLAGAHGFGIDCLFVTRGIHSEEFEGLDQLDPASVKDLFGHPPRALIRELKW